MHRALSLRLRAVLVAVLVIVSSSCRGMALASAPQKTPIASRSAQAQQAERAFELALVAGDYAALAEVTEALTRAYLAAPRDPTLALYLGHAHFWRVAERARDPDPRATLTDHLLIAERYFTQAELLRPEDYRILGWLGSAKLALGNVHADERWTREGYFMLEDGVEAFREFNLFSKSYTLSLLPRDHPRFPEALDAMWESVEACNARGLDRKHPDFAPYFRPSPAVPLAGPQRVCHNLPKAPHNFEGFFLHNGDLLVKAGKPGLARVMYANARLEPGFANWVYRDVLEERIVTAETRARRFASKDRADWPEMMVASRLSCSGCHQR
jgi:hypothetical protein